jgi:hypothetical protein
MVNWRAERQHPDQEVQQYTESLRGIFAAGMPANAPIDQVTKDVRPQVREILQNAYGGGAAVADQISDMEEHDRRTENWRGGNPLLSPIPFLTNRRVRKTGAETVSDVNLDTQMHWFMNQQNVAGLLNAPAHVNIRNLLERRLGADILDHLEDHPEIRFGIALAFSQGANPAAIEDFVMEALGDAGRVNAFTGAHTARRAYETSKTCLDNLESGAANISGAVNEMTADGNDVVQRWTDIDTELTALRAGGGGGVGAGARNADVRRITDLENSDKGMQAKKQKLQNECTKIYESADFLNAHYAALPGGVPAALAAHINLLLNNLGPAGAAGVAPGVNWAGNTVPSWTSIQACINFLNSDPFSDAIHALRPHFEHVTSNHKREYERAKTALTVSQDGLDDRLSASDFLYKIWFEIYEREATPAAGGPPNVDRSVLRERALMAAMTSLSESRDEDLLKYKNEIRCEELARRSSLWRRAISRHNFSPSANSVLARIRHVTVNKEGKEVKPFAGLDLNKSMSRAELRKTIKEGKLAREDIPRLYLHLEAILKNHRDHTIKPKDASFLIDLIQNLKVVRNEMLHEELLQQFRNTEGTPEQDILKLLKAKMDEEKKWEKQLADDILKGEFLKTITPRAIRKEKRSALKEIKQKMNSGEWGYNDSVAYLKEKGFSPGIMKKAHLFSRKMKNWFTPRKKDPDKPGLTRRAAGSLWRGTTWLPRKAGGLLGKGAKKVLGVPLGIFETLTGMLFINPLKWTSKIFSGGSGSVGKVRNKYRWFSEAHA